MLNTRLKIRAILFFLLVLIFLPGVKALPFPQPGEREIAIALFREGEYGKALPIFSKLAYDFPYDFLLKYFTGACLVETGQYGLDAEKNLVLASAREVPSKVYYYLGKLYHANSNWNNAQRYYNRYRNNSDSMEVRESGVDELSNLCAGQINPFSKATILTEKRPEPEIPAIAGAKSGQSEKPGVTEPASVQPGTAMQTETVRKEPVHVDIPKSDDAAAVIAVNQETGVALQQPQPPAPEAKTNIPVQPPGMQVSLPAPEKTADSLMMGQGTLNPDLPERTPAGLTASPESTHFIHFRVNDRVTYETEEMFQVPEAFSAFKAARDLERRLDSLLTQTDSLRKSYHHALNPVTRDSLARLISAEEYLSLQLKSDMERGYFRAASIEQEWWKDADYPVYEAFYRIRDSIIARTTTPPPVIPEPGPDVFGTSVDSVIVVPEIETGDTREKTVPPEVKADELSYRIQVGAFTKGIPAQKKALFDKISKIRVIETFVNEKGETVYTTGNLKSFEDAVKLQNQVRQEGIKDAFVIAVKNGKRVSLQK